MNHVQDHGQSCIEKPAFSILSTSLDSLFHFAFAIPAVKLLFIMSMGVPRPRITGSMLGNFVGSTVCLAGQVVEVDTVSRQWVRIETGEGVQLMCRATMGDEFEVSDGFVEVLGTVTDPKSLDLQFYVSLGSEFDLGQYDEAVKLSAQYPEIFPQRPV